MSHPIGPGRARDEARRQANPPRPRPVAEPLTVRYARQYAQLLRIARPVMAGILGLLAALAVDYSLAREHREKVLDYERTNHYQHTTRYSRGTISGHQYRLFTAQGYFDAPEQVPTGSEVLVCRTPLARLAVAAYSIPERTPIELQTFFSGARLFLLLAAGVAAVLALLPRFDADLRTKAALAAVAAASWLVIMWL